MTAPRKYRLGVLGSGKGSNFVAIADAIAGDVEVDSHQRSFLLATFAESFHESSSHMRAARPVAFRDEVPTPLADEEEPDTLVDSKPVRRRGWRRFVYALTK